MNINEKMLLQTDPAQEQQNETTQEKTSQRYSKFSNSYEEYVKIGTKFYRKVIIPAATPGKYLGERLEIWTKAAIFEDYEKSEALEIIEKMEKYKAFVVRPNHINYERNVEGYYNLYEPLKYQPSIHPGPFVQTEEFLHHIFAEQYEICLDYIQLLYLKPLQKLHILCLVSTERNTGKTTFLNWVNLIFDKNFTFINSEDLEGKFNSDWTTKHIVAIDETFIDSKKGGERLKNLSTTKMFKTEAKQKDKVETEFNGKFMCASNNVENFLPIGEGEIRYWVRYVKPLKSDNVNLLEELEKEIPAFLNYLLTRKMHTPKPMSRMWHKPEDVWTPALEIAMNGSKSSMEQLVIEVIKDYYYEFDEDLKMQGEVDPWLKLAPLDIVALLKRASGGGPAKYNTKDIKKIFNDKWGLQPINSSYKFYSWVEMPQGNEMSTRIIYASNQKGRYYSIPLAKLGL